MAFGAFRLGANSGYEARSEVAPVAESGRQRLSHFGRTQTQKSVPRPAAESQKQPFRQRCVQGGRIFLRDQHEAPVRRKARGKMGIGCGGQDDQQLLRKCGGQDKQCRRHNPRPRNISGRSVSDGAHSAITPKIGACAWGSTEKTGLPRDRADSTSSSVTPT